MESWYTGLSEFCFTVLAHLVMNITVLLESFFSMSERDQISSNSTVCFKKTEAKQLARQGFCPQSDATTFALSSNSILLLCIPLSTILGDYLFTTVTLLILYVNIISCHSWLLMLHHKVLHSFVTWKEQPPQKTRVGHPFFSKEHSDLCALFRSL